MGAVAARDACDYLDTHLDEHITLDSPSSSRLWAIANPGPGTTFRFTLIAEESAERQ